MPVMKTTRKYFTELYSLVLFPEEQAQAVSRKPLWSVQRASAHRTDCRATDTFYSTIISFFRLQTVFPIIRRLFQPREPVESLCRNKSSGKGTGGRSKPAAARIVPFHAGASTCRNNTVFHSPTGLYAAGFGLSASVPYLSLVTCRVKDKR